jgi:hypothetical protein
VANPVKKQIADAIFDLVNNNSEVIQIPHGLTRVDDLNFQIKVWEKEGHPPLYFNVKISEMV